MFEKKITCNQPKCLRKPTSMVMTFNPKPALIMSTVFSLPVPNTDKDSEED